MEYSSSEEQALGRSRQLSPEQEPISKSPPTNSRPGTIGQPVNIEDVYNVSSEREEEEEA